MNFRPRFSIRTLLVAVTLVGLYFGCWELTKRWGLEKLEPAADDGLMDYTLTSPEAPTDEIEVDLFPFHASPGPFVVMRERVEYRNVPGLQVEGYREYHLWFFGVTRKLYERPLELKVDVVESPVLIQDGPAP